MLASNYTQEILNLQDVIVEKVENLNKKQRIYIKLVRKEVNCPCCKVQTSKIHDYRTQIVKDAEAFGKKVELVLRKRRYICNACGKRFAEPNSFLPKYHRMTSRLIEIVIEIPVRPDGVTLSDFLCHGRRVKFRFDGRHVAVILPFGRN